MKPSPTEVDSFVEEGLNNVADDVANQEPTQAALTVALLAQTIKAQGRFTWPHVKNQTQ